MVPERLAPELEAELAAALERERDELRATRRRLAAAERVLSESQAEEDGAGGAGADVATDLLEQEIDLSLERSTAGRLAEVEAALERLAAGGYGWCERCQRPIPVERLRAMPWVRDCVECARHART